MEFAVPIDFGNILARPMSFKERAVVETHQHNFPHVTLVAKGKARIEELDGQDGNVLRSVEKVAGDMVLIKAQVWHRITKLEEDTFCVCLYAHRNPQGEVVQAYDGWGASYV
jgi:quercetin dioxygenase-like cupin family protein